MATVCIVNLEGVRTLAREQGARLQSQSQREWLERAVMRHVVGSGDCLKATVPSRAELSSAHVARAVAGGESTVRFSPSAELLRDVALIVDWLAGLQEREPRQARKLRRIAFADALEMSRRWHGKLRKAAERKQARAIPADPIGAPVVLDAASLGLGWSWVWLKSPEARKAEGEAMGHCVGSGGYESLGPSEAILSLRDPDGGPHLTLHLKGGRIAQVAAKGNGSVPARYGTAVNHAAAVIGLRMLLEGSPRNVIPDGWFEQDGPEQMRRAIHIEGGLIHRSIGPAVKWDDGRREWYHFGKLHREDGPAAVWADGTKIWCRKGRHHREDGPAVELADGTRKWFLDGKLHREDGPAVEWGNGAREWYWDDQLHREHGPAVKWADGREDWYRRGKLHRHDGPAVKYADGTEACYVDGARISLWRRLSGIFP